MALHTELSIHKVAYDLLDVITDLVRKMPRDFKQSLGATRLYRGASRLSDGLAGKT